MPEEADFEISGSLRARELRLTTRPCATTKSQHVQLEHTDQRHDHDQEVQPDRTYEDIEIERSVRGEIAME
jgi:hypothetical protein